MNLLNTKIKAKEEKIRFCNAQLTTNEAKIKVNDLKDEIAQLEMKLSDLDDQTNMVDQDTMKAAKKTQNVNVKEWRKRKRMFADMTDAILENWPNPKKALFEEIGVETDQDVGVNMPEI